MLQFDLLALPCGSHDEEMTSIANGGMATYTFRGHEEVGLRHLLPRAPVLEVFRCEDSERVKFRSSPAHPIKHGHEDVGAKLRTVRAPRAYHPRAMMHAKFMHEL
jgi:hypothetical protein